ncbi:hypothetical protein [Occallatibacter savannae]|uniref:hypothetical protein n=1 Tax=Occallatibacter savannae TaxID=1002691 RepID=UPI000D68796B|nr:hypothetical protein [Occallatibacter savannae]
MDHQLSTSENEPSVTPPTNYISPTDSVRELVKQALFLYEEGEKVNIRVLFDNNRMTSLFSKRKTEIAEVIAKNDDDTDIKAIFVQLQVLDPTTLTDITKGKGVQRHHILKYRWFVVDVDTCRPNKSTSNASEEEKVLSRETTIAVRAYLQSAGWPEPILCDSGNGWHLVWRIDLSNTDEHFHLLQSCLRALAHKFNSEHAEIDVSLAEPEQIIKLWGTTVRKGEDTAERPWRRSRVLDIPFNVEIVSLETLQGLASQAPEGKISTRSCRKENSPIHPDFEPEDFFEWCEDNLPPEYAEFFGRDSDADHEDRRGRHYVMDGCFWSERKHSGNRRKTEFILGRTFGFSCFSDDCCGVGIGDILRKVTMLAGRPYPEQIWEEDDSIFEGVDDVDIQDEEGDATDTTEDIQSHLPSQPEADEPASIDSDSFVQGDTKASEPLLTAGGEQSDPLAFPVGAMYGKLGEMATAMKMPLGLAYPAVLGAYSVIPQSDEMSETRINAYTILLAPPGGGKNVAIKRALAMVDIPKEDYRKAAPVSDRGLMTLVGHRIEKKRGGQKEITRGPRKLLLVTNEAANVLKKANIKNSSLGATFCELWDENIYAAVDRNGEQPCDCRLSWLGGLPIRRDHPEEFGEYFGRETGRGLLSRTILGFSDVKFNYQSWSAPSLWSNDEAGNFDAMAFQHPNTVKLPDECIQMLNSWKASDEEEEGRLKYIARKVALLTASANGDREVGDSCMKAAIEFVNWQGRLREVFRIGVAAEYSLEAQFAEALIGALRQKGGEQKYIGWRRLAHDRKWIERFGPRVVNTTVENLITSETLIPRVHIVEDEEGRKKAEKDISKVRLRDWNKK